MAHCACAPFRDEQCPPREDRGVGIAAASVMWNPRCVVNDLPLGDAHIDMEPLLQRGNEDLPRVERSRPLPDASAVVLVVLAAVLVAIVFLLLTSGSTSG